MAEPSDPELISRCLSGDARAWEDLLLRYRRLVLSVPLRMRLPHADAEEVLQDTFATLVEKLGTVRDHSRLGPWLAVTSQRFALMRIRRAGREAPIAPDYHAAGPADLPLEELVRLEWQDAVQQALETLGGRCHDLLRAFYWEDPRPSFKELSARFGIPGNSLGPTRLRCLEKLRRLLPEELTRDRGTRQPEPPSI